MSTAYTFHIQSLKEVAALFYRANKAGIYIKKAMQCQNMEDDKSKILEGALLSPCTKAHFHNFSDFNNSLFLC